MPTNQEAFGDRIAQNVTRSIGDEGEAVIARAARSAYVQLGGDRVAEVRFAPGDATRKVPS